jgi:flagellar protein FlaG
MVMNVSNAATDTAALGRSVPSSNTPAVSGVPKRQGVAVAGEGSDQTSGPKSDGVSETVMKAAVTRLSDYVQNLQRNLEFSVDEVTGCTVVTVVDAQTDEVIRQIPAKEVLAVMQDLASREAGTAALGLLVREEA